MTDAAERARHLYYCLKEAQEEGVWIDTQLTLIASIIREAEEVARAEAAEDRTRWQRLVNACADAWNNGLVAGDDAEAVEVAIKMIRARAEKG